MKNDRFYINIATGEKTESRSDAMFWYRCGMPVEVWKRGRRILALMM